MPKKKHHINLDYKHGLIDVNKSDPSPFQVRKYFDQDKLKELGESIQREGLIEPLMVRRKGSRYEIIAGERRFRAVRDFTEMKTIPAQIVKATDLETRRISAAENIQRENLSAIETIEAIVAIVDAELIEDKQYAATGKKPAELNRPRVSPFSSQETVIHTMSRLGIPVGRLAARLKINRKTAKKYSENPRLIRPIKKSLKKGLACHKVAEEHD